MKNIKLSVVLVIVTVMLALVPGGCKKEPSGFSLTSLNIGKISITDSTMAPDVSVEPVLIAIFNYNVDSSTVDPANILLVQDYDNTVVSVNISSSGNAITITPKEALSYGALYKITFKADIKSSDGLELTEVTRTFQTLGTFVPNGMIAYWNFENNAKDQVGTFHPTTYGVFDITYVDSRNDEAGKSANFNGTTSIIEIPNGDTLMKSEQFAISFWVKTNSAGHVNENGNPAGYFVMGLGAFFGFEFEISADFSSCNFVASYDIGGMNAVSEDLWFSGDGKDRDHGGWQGWEFCKDLRSSGGLPGLLKDKWTHVVYKFEPSTRRATLYINGEKMKIVNFNLWTDGNVRKSITGLRYNGSAPVTDSHLAFGFIQSRAGTFYDTDPRYGYDYTTSDHFKGQLDDIRIFHKSLTEDEIQLMYASEK